MCVYACVQSWTEKFSVTSLLLLMIFYQKNLSTTTLMEEECGQQEGLYLKMNLISSHFMRVSSSPMNLHPNIYL